MNRGSNIDGKTETVTIRASMRPRFMNRGSKRMAADDPNGILLQ